jgi:hypothetical protein
LRRNCLLKHFITEKIERRKEVTGRGGRRLRQLLDDLKENRGYGKLKRKHLIAFCRELALEEDRDLS